jgi:membrane-bound lytic murein transglycosylase D
MIKYLLFGCAIVWLGCQGRPADPPPEPVPAVPAPVPRDPAVDSLRAEVQALADIVRRSNVIALPETLRFCGERVPVERWWVRKDLEEAFRFYTGFARNRKRIDVYLRESRVYFPFIVERLREESVPEDLKYVPVAESELNLQAQSSQKAVGPWQLMSSTGREQSLRMTKYIDERKDFERATDAAIRKLRNDRGELGSWFLALAAYNAGLNRVKRALAEHGDSSYFNLVLPPEAMEYCYRLVALKYILEHPHRYGFSERPEGERAIQVVSHAVKVKTTIPELARTFGMPAREFQLLNPQFTSGSVPPGTYRVKVPLEPFETNGSSDSNHSAPDTPGAAPGFH